MLNVSKAIAQMEMEPLIIKMGKNILESGRTAKVTARELTSGLIEVYTRESSRMTTGMARELSITKTVTSILVSGERVICTARE